MEWPITQHSNPPGPVPSKRTRALGHSLFGDADEFDQVDVPTRIYWTSVKNRHKDVPLETVLQSPEINCLPENWTVINISISDGEDLLLVSRSRPKQRSLLFCIPLNRSGRNETDTETSGLTVKSAVSEISDIVDSSRKNGKRAKEVAAKGRDARAEWWSERAILDQRLSELLENIEFCWLGAFKVPTQNWF